MSRRSGRSGPGRLGRVAVAVVAMATVGLAACEDGPTQVEVVFEVIEEVEFAPSLNIDLAAMTELPEGVYIQDLVAGTGPGLTDGDTAWLYYELYLSNGTPIQNGLLNDFAYPATQTIEGFNVGLAGMSAGTARLMLIPPELGYGATANGPIPGGSILVFQIELDSIT